MHITLQSNEGLCWFSSVIFLLKQVDFNESFNTDLVTCLKEISKAKRLQKTKKRKIKKAKKPNMVKKSFWEHQDYIFHSIHEAIFILKDIQPNAPNIKWNINEISKDMPTEYALLCILQSLGLHSNLETNHIDNEDEYFESYYHPYSKYNIKSIYFDDVGTGVNNFIKESETNTFELTIDIGMQYLHSVILTEVCEIWYILDPNIGTFTVESLQENEFKRVIISLFEMNSEKTSFMSSKVEYKADYINLKGILTLSVRSSEQTRHFMSPDTLLLTSVCRLEGTL